MQKLPEAKLFHQTSFRRADQVNCEFGVAVNYSEHRSRPCRHPASYTINDVKYCTRHARQEALAILLQATKEANNLSHSSR